MIFDPSNGDNLGAEKKQLAAPDATAAEEAKQGKKISAAFGEEYAAEMQDRLKSTLGELQQMGRALIGHVKDIQDQSLALGSLAAALEAGAYRQASLDIDSNPAGGAAEGSDTNSYQVSRELANVADSIHQLLKTCDALTTSVRKYAEAHLEISKGSEELGLGLTHEKTLEYLKQNEGRSLDQLESRARWIVDNFEDVIASLRLHLDALIGSLQAIARDEYEFIQAVLLQSPQYEFTAINQLVASDKASRKELLEKAITLRASIQDESTDPQQVSRDSVDENMNYSDKMSGLLIEPIMRLRQSLLAEASE